MHITCLLLKAPYPYHMTGIHSTCWNADQGLSGSTTRPSTLVIHLLLVGNQLLEHAHNLLEQLKRAISPLINFYTTAHS